VSSEHLKPHGRVVRVQPRARGGELLVEIVDLRSGSPALVYLAVCECMANVERMPGLAMMNY